MVLLIALASFGTLLIKSLTHANDKIRPRLIEMEKSGLKKAKKALLKSRQIGRAIESALRRDMSIEPDHKSIQAPEERHRKIAGRPFMPLLTELGVLGNRFSINLSHLTVLTWLRAPAFQQSQG